MSEPAGEAKLELKQASKEVKESENVAEKYSAMTVSKNSEMNMGELSSAFSAVPTHKPVKKVRNQPDLCVLIFNIYTVWQMHTPLLVLSKYCSERASFIW